MTRHFLDLTSIGKTELNKILKCAAELKAERKNGKLRDSLKNKTLASIFEKPSTRTRVSFEVGIKELGGESLVLQKDDLQLGRGETVADTARVLSRYVHILMLRANSHATLEELAEYADIPVINGLTDLHHPCQIMADLLTIQEHTGSFEGKTISWIGDGNNVCHSFMEAAHILGFTLNIAAPKGFAPTFKLASDNIKFFDSPQDAAKDSDVIVTDTWFSMGDDDTLSKRKSFSNYQVDDALMALAKPNAIFMHCLPAHREEEVSTSVLDGKQSVIFDEAENRLHAQKAIMLWCMEQI